MPGPDVIGQRNSLKYDKWGKILSIDTAQSGNKEQLEIAQINPLRYRGYYYDNESGLYYLQSRYYDPELGRFISADSTENINTNNVLALNAYIYCWNSPIAFSDSAGTYPKLSINTGDITAIFNWISKKTDENIDNTFNGINKLVGIFHKINEKYKAKRDNTLQKIDDFFANPIETINTAFDKLKNSKIGQALSAINNSVKEKISNDLNSAKEFLIEKVFLVRVLHNFVGKIKEKISSKNSSSEEEQPTAAFGLMKAKGSKNDNNAKMAIVQGLFGGIVLDSIKNFFSSIKINLEKIMKQSIKNNTFNIFKESMFSLSATFTTTLSYAKSQISITNLSITGYEKIMDKFANIAEDSEDFVNASKGRSFLNFFSIFSAFINFKDSIDNADNGVLSKKANIINASISLHVILYLFYLEKL